MLSGDKRGVSARRGMTVLGKIPAVPKPINLPSQRLENRGLDPNVEIVPRGSVSWGSAGRSPPTSGNVWGNSQQSVSPPVSRAPWGTSTTSNGVLVGSASRPSSAGSGTRPSTADSNRQTQELINEANAWNFPTSRPASASGVLGQSHSQPTLNRPRSAETWPANLQGTSARSSESYAGIAPSQAWGAREKKILVDKPPQPARFTLSHGDFPSLGSEKTQEPCPQHGTKEDENKEKEMMDNWKRDGAPADGLFSGPDGNWHAGRPPVQSYAGQFPISESWRNDEHGVASFHSSNDYWHRSGPPTGPYGASAGPVPPPGRFPYDSARFMPHQQFRPGPMPPLHGGPTGFDQHGDRFRSVPFMRPPIMPERPGPPFGPGFYPGPMPYEGYGASSGVSGSGYVNIDERDMMMVGIGSRPGFHGAFPHRQGPAEPFGLYRPGIRFDPHQTSHPGIAREGVAIMEYDGESQHEQLTNKVLGFKENDYLKDGGNRMHARQPGIIELEGNSWKKEGRSGANAVGSQVQRHSFQGIPESSSHGHQDWGAADEPMDFSRPVFEDAAASEWKKESNQTLRGSDLLSLDSRTEDTQREDSRRAFLEETPTSLHVLSNNSRLKAAEEISNSEKSTCKEAVFSENGKAHSLEQNSAKAGEDLLEIKLNALQDSVDGDHSINDPPVQEDRYTGLNENVRTSKKDSQSNNNVVESSDYNNTRFCLGNMASAETSASFAISSFTSCRDEVSGFSEKHFEGLPSESGSSPIVVETVCLPFEKFLQEPASSEKLSSPAIEAAEKSEHEKSNERTGVTFIAVDQKGETTVYAGSTHVQHSKEEPKPRSNIALQEVEKEWRPKSVKGARGEKSKSLSSNTLVEMKVSSSFQSVVPLSESAHVTNKSVAGSKYAASSDSYDYDAQRVRMKEIAAQRARQLEKEERERTKEKKEKALAKFQELNRRTVTGVPQSSNSSNSEPLKEISEVNSASVQLEVCTPVSTPIEHNEKDLLERGHVKHEQGKQERVGDEKVELSREEFKTNLGDLENKIVSKEKVDNVSSVDGVEQTLLPDPESDLVTVSHNLPKISNESADPSQADANSSQPQDGHKSSGQQRLNLNVPHPRYRSKTFASQSKRASRLSDIARNKELGKADMLTGANDQNVGDQPVLTMPVLDVNPTEVSGKKIVARQLGQLMPFQKRQGTGTMKNGPKAEVEENSINLGTTAIYEVFKVDDEASDGTVAVKNIIIPSSNIINTKVNECSTLFERVSTSVWKDGLQVLGEQSKGTEEEQIHIKRISQKRQQNKRPLRDRLSQDVRASDKQNIGDGMIWAPVGVISSDHGRGSQLNEDVINDATSLGRDADDNQQITRAKRAELERYTPKAVMKQHTQKHRASETVLSSGEMSSTLLEKEIMPHQSSLSSMARASTGPNQRQNPDTNNQQRKPQSEGRQHEFLRKSGRFPASWRQRGLVAEQVNDDVMEALVHSMDDTRTSPTPQREMKGRGFDNQQQEHRLHYQEQRSRHADAGWGSEQTYFRKTSKFQQETRPSSSQKNLQNHAIPIHENHHQKLAIKEDITEVADHSSVPVATARHHGNLQNFEHVAKNIVQEVGHLKSDTIETVQQATASRKPLRDQQNPGEQAPSSPRSPELLRNQGHEIQEPHGWERHNSHQKEFTHPLSRSIPLQASKARRFFLQGIGGDLSTTHSSTQQNNAVNSHANVEHALPCFSEKTSKEVSSDLQFGSYAPQHMKGGSSFDAHGRGNRLQILHQQSKQLQSNRKEGLNVAFDHEQRGSNSYRQRSGFGQYQQKGSASQDKQQQIAEGHDPYQQPQSITSGSSKQHRVALINKDNEPTTSHHHVRLDSSKELSQSPEVDTQQLPSAMHQQTHKSSQQVETFVASGTIHENDKRFWSQGGGSPNLHGREHGVPRQGKFGGRMNVRGTDADLKKTHLPSSQATAGC
ncbi:hypothetical protein O6H91_08G104500 [Diphasiastrum complanatum]|uniref:Uncharacterized protein n=7 Tax=Diphasiastrum complanatum TaxID=34168 RepID=A0ACC2D0K5_DIPCM|nr:hypothetical protein O6H91_08G104500 [Diphasiastrum complanatum]KAJ7547786.1 hypothetical protein O6H91_08G104500 [Diphasiastrum complanatum]KAJ7547787.1 hypothetical protein O6H91_08G104500 [Diphasiastrum complanatum]KAJ7547788.1 hypothetical protein O6H91_08G104500 [Diphasiastrum complanatum]KAJ7547789.1 hypothetical protein O6H91_08G104500 [Diphasiastrum complanatum]